MSNQWRSSSRGVFACLLLLSLLCQEASNHPQCTNSSPAFTFKEANMYCDHYANFTCCTVEMDIGVRQAVEGIATELQNRGKEVCIGLLKEVLCQECSPYAAHAFDTELGGEKRPFAGICKDFCGTLYTSCADEISLITKDKRILTSLQSQRAFCDEVSIPDVKYCYPEILDNTDLNKELKRTVSTVDGCICLEEYTGGFNNPLFLTATDDVDHADILYIAVHTGTIYAYQNGKRKSVFLDVTSKTILSTRYSDERGLLSFTFHPNFKQHPKVYLNYFVTDAIMSFSRISEFKVINPFKADPKSERIIMEIRQFAPSHNVGSLLFGEDGYLYITAGDGGTQWDQLKNGQNTKTPLAAVLRIDVDNFTKKQPYSVPKDNPFVGKPGILPEIYAYGFRNPWRASVDRGDPITGEGKGRIFLGDVGQNTWEEINLVKAGGNYGWSVIEGPRCAQQCDTPAADGPFEPPIHVYDHTIGEAVIGGYVYRGCESPNFNGLYFYAEHNPGTFFALKEVKVSATKSRWENRKIQLCGDDMCFNGLTNKYGKFVLTFGEDYNGEVYAVTSNYPVPFGDRGKETKILKLVDPRVRGDPETCRAHREKNQSSQPPTQPPTPPTQPPTTAAGCVLDTSWRYPKRLKVSVPGRRKKIKCNRCSCEKMESKHLKLLEAACNGNTQARVKCCPLCKKHGFI